MIGCRKLILSALTLFCCGFGALCGAAGNPSPWDLWREGYETFEAGEKMRAKGDYASALNAFKLSLERYERVRKMRPDWNQSVLEERIATCKKEIFALQKNLPEPLPAAAVPQSSAAPTPGAAPVYVSAPATVPAATMAELENLRRECEGYKSRLYEVMSESDELRRQLEQHRNTAKEIADLLREQRVLQEKYSLLEKRSQSLEKQLLEPDTRLEEARNQLLEEKLNSELLQKRLQLSDGRIKKLENDLLNANRDRDGGAEEVKLVRAELARAERELEMLNSAAAENRKKVAALELQITQGELKNKELSDHVAEQSAEIEAVHRRLAEAIKKGGDSQSFNSELLAENKNLRAAQEAQLRENAAGASRIAELESELRALRLELVRAQDTSRSIEDARKRLEVDRANAVRESERAASNSGLLEMELKNLRDRSRQLENDTKTWSERYAKLEERLKSREDQISRQSSAYEEELGRRTKEFEKLSVELAAEKGKVSGEQLKAAQLQEELKAQSEARKKIQESVEVANRELAALRARAATADELEKQVAAAQKQIDTLRNSGNELAAARSEIDALKNGLAAARNEFDGQKKQLEAARLRTAELEKYPALLVDEQKANQSLTELQRGLAETNRRLLGRIAELTARLDGANQRCAALEHSIKESGGVPAVDLSMPESEVKVAVPDLPSPETLLADGGRAEQEQSWELAIWNYQTALESDPECYEAALKLGNIYLKEENYERAEDALGKAALIRPGDREAALGHARALIGMGKPGNALGVIEPRLAAGNDDFELQLLYGKALADSGQAQLAERALKRAGELNDNSPELALTLARLWCKSAPQRAAEAYAKARDLNVPPDPELERELGKLVGERREMLSFMRNAAAEAAKSGDYAGAQWYYKQLMEKDSGNFRNGWDFAYCDYLMQHYDEALAQLKRLPQDQPPVVVLQVMALARLGKFTEAGILADKHQGLKLLPGWGFLAAAYQDFLGSSLLKDSMDANRNAPKLRALL